MPSIGAVSCFRVSGVALLQNQRVQTFGIVGVDGVGVHLLGNYGDPSTFVAKQFGSSAGLATWFNSLVALKGTIVTIVNDEGASNINQLIENVDAPQKQNANDLQGSTAIWTVQVKTRTV